MLGPVGLGLAGLPPVHAVAAKSRARNAASARAAQAPLRPAGAPPTPWGEAPCALMCPPRVLSGTSLRPGPEEVNAWCDVGDRDVHHDFGPGAAPIRDMNDKGPAEHSAGPFLLSGRYRHCGH